MTQQRYYEGLTAAQEAKIEELRGLVVDTAAVSSAGHPPTHAPTAWGLRHAACRVVAPKGRLCPAPAEVS